MLVYATGRCTITTDNKKVGSRSIVLTVGAPCCGMNAAIQAFVKQSRSIVGNEVYLCYNGFNGLIEGNIKSSTDISLNNLVSKAGSVLGTNRYIPYLKCEFDKIIENIKELGIERVLIIGGFEAYVGGVRLSEIEKEIPCLKIIYIPATLSNNIYPSEYSIGCDTALNVITKACDIIKQSASSSRKRVFIVEVQGGSCGYISILSALAAGASRVYVPEEPFKLENTLKDIKQFGEMFKTKSPQGRLVLRNENTAEGYTTEILSKIFEKEGGGEFDSRFVVLGHLQQGGHPSPIDRIRGTNLGSEAAQILPREAFTALIYHESEISCMTKSLMTEFTNFASRTSTFTPWLDLKRYLLAITW